MNRGIVVSRYARALVKYVNETGNGPVVCSEAEALAHALHVVPDLARLIESKDVVSSFEKKKLLHSALGGRISPELSRFITLLLRKGRIDMIQDIMRDFVDAYRRSMGVRKAYLTCVSEPSERFLQRLKALVREKTGDDVVIQVTLDPSLIGGFIFDIDDYLMDASVKRQLDLIREEFIEKNRRIV